MKKSKPLDRYEIMNVNFAPRVASMTPLVAFDSVQFVDDDLRRDIMAYMRNPAHRFDMYADKAEQGWDMSLNLSCLSDDDEAPPIISAAFNVPEDQVAEIVCLAYQGQRYGGGRNQASVAKAVKHLQKLKYAGNAPNVLHSHYLPYGPQYSVGVPLQFFAMRHRQGGYQIYQLANDDVHPREYVQNSKMVINALRDYDEDYILPEAKKMPGHVQMLAEQNMDMLLYHRWRKGIHMIDDVFQGSRPSLS